MDAPLTLLVAPAGSGKSVLLTQWAAALDGVLVGWLDLSGADDDAVYFARRLIDELQGISEGFAELAHAPRAASTGLGDALIEALAASFADALEEVVVIFDDLHRLSNREIVTDLWRLVDRLPGNAHFVFSSRIDLSLGFSRHRLEYAPVELRQSDLAFNGAEAAALLSRITRRSIDDETAAAVVEHTEGWAAGIQLSGLGLRFRTDARQFMDALVDSDRLVIDYLSEEVLDAQSPERLQALLDLSVLDELTPGVVEAVAGMGDGAAFLGELERESLFVIPVAGKPGRFRFHHLFRDLLRYRLRATDIDAEASLLRTVAEWHTSHGDLAIAIEALLAGSHWSGAMDLILTRGREVYERGETATVARWLAEIPSEERRPREDAELLYAVLEGMSGRPVIAETAARELLADPAVTSGMQVVGNAYLSGLVQFLPHPRVYIEDGTRALELLATTDDHVALPNLLNLTQPATLEIFAKISVARGHLLLGDSGTARALMREALEGDRSAYAPYRIHALGSLALAEAWDGYLRRATDLADEALEMSRQLDLLTHAAPADAYLARSLVAIKRGEPEAGAFALHEGYVRAASNARAQLMWIAHAEARLVDPDGTELTAHSPATPPPPLVADALEAIARRQQRESGRPAKPTNTRTWSRVAYEDVASMLASGDPGAARTRLASFAFPDPMPPSVYVDVQLLGAWIADLERRLPESREHLRRALDAAQPEELVQPFRRAGSRVLQLIRELPGAPDGFRRVILERTGIASQRPPMETLIEPLTARELELLAYLPSRLTNAELAARCFVSLNTVKTHMAHIYRKLGANGRDAAIARARELGLIEEPDVARMG
ncbi:LuxR family transcriptional regulator [Microbacterium aoyamense]|uniref:LuxR family transcriptional regulator n=2 Tax=Microbacterium aoyamense TaxID=344166 RepID=A0ABP5AXN4_9MICO